MIEPKLYNVEFSFVCRIPGGFVQTGSRCVAGFDEVDASERACRIIAKSIGMTGSDFLEILSLEMIDTLWGRRVAARDIKRDALGLLP